MLNLKTKSNAVNIFVGIAHEAHRSKEIYLDL